MSTAEAERPIPMLAMGSPVFPLSTNITAETGTAKPQEVKEPIPLGATLQPRVPVVTQGAGRSLQIRQLWEGTVTEVLTDRFVATLSDKTQPRNPDEQAVFEFGSFEVTEDDVPLVAAGAVFYLMMGTEKAQSGSIRNVSSIEFRRLPLWTRNSLETASNRATSLKDWFESAQ